KECGHEDHSCPHHASPFGFVSILQRCCSGLRTKPTKARNPSSLLSKQIIALCLESRAVGISNGIHAPLRHPLTGRAIRKTCRSREPRRPVISELANGDSTGSPATVARHRLSLETGD